MTVTSGGTYLDFLLLIAKADAENPDVCQHCGDITKGNLGMCGRCESELERYSLEEL